MDSFGARFGRLIRDKRGIESFSQDDLAQRSGLTKARISDIERGRVNNPQTKTIDAITVALNISKEELDGCRSNPRPQLPPRLLENLALRFGYANPDASEDALEAFLKEKAVEFREMQERLAQMNALDSGIATSIRAANAALEEGDFQLADKHLHEAEQVQFMLATLPALEAQYQLRSERAQAALLAGEINRATQHWEKASNYFRHIDRKVEAEKRYSHCTRLREYG
jgi:transcriptional regulator with XRE-family HTH domain